jgi:hypothetical protein
MMMMYLGNQGGVHLPIAPRFISPQPNSITTQTATRRH